MCSANHKCHSFTILAGENCRGSSKGPLRYHTFAQGAASADKNPDWTAYVKPGGPSPSPAPTNPFVTKVKCAMRQLAARMAHKRIGSVFGPRGDALVAAALRYDVSTRSPCFVTHYALCYQNPNPRPPINGRRPQFCTPGWTLNFSCISTGFTSARIPLGRQPRVLPRMHAVSPTHRRCQRVKSPSTFPPPETTATLATRRHRFGHQCERVTQSGLHARLNHPGHGDPPLPRPRWWCTMAPTSSGTRAAR